MKKRGRLKITASSRGPLTTKIKQKIKTPKKIFKWKTRKQEK